MGALWQYRWLVLVLLIAPTIAYCQYRAVEKLAAERCANAGGTWAEDESECTGLPPPRATAAAAPPEGDAGTTDSADEARFEEAPASESKE
jgi:hypothetical protein